MARETMSLYFTFVVQLTISITLKCILIKNMFMDIDPDCTKLFSLQNRRSDLYSSTHISYSYRLTRRHWTYHDLLLLCVGIDEERVCGISAVVMLRRSDKQPDRVEISPEQLTSAAIRAEHLSHELQRPMRVIGWYHSHPHITVWPSHVDVQTQANYQLMDEGFIGLIFSVFNQEKTSKENKIQVTCFQSINQSPEGEPPQLIRLEMPLHIVPTDSISRPCLETLIQLPSILSEEEEEVYSKTKHLSDIDLLSKIHNSAVFMKALCHIMEVMSGPLMQTLEMRHQRNKAEIVALKQQKQQLQKQLDTAGKQQETAGVKLSDSTHKSTSV